MNKSIVFVAILTLLALVMAGTLLASSPDGNGATTTSGAIQTFATGLDRGHDVSGQVTMVRSPAGKTLVNVHATGLAPSTTYGSHVHNQPCDVSNGGGHYQQDTSGPADAVNEIWPGFTTNEAGIGQGMAANDYWARPEAQSVVIHDTDGARIACADLN